jgi:nitrite reductase/ring-hydroxylating ferredoxin subunit
MKSILKYSVIMMFVAALLSSAWSCNKTVEHESIPNVAVNMYLDISSTMYIELSTIGGYVYVTGGYKGIIIYRVSPEDFVAYDRGCPFDPTLACARIEMDPSGITLTDSCCGSNFSVLDGSIIKGPATQPLKRYHTQFDGQMLRVWN